MAKTIVGLFDTFDEAQQVTQALLDSGFSHDAISVVSNNARGEYAHERGAGESKAAEGAGAGALTGAVGGGVIGMRRRSFSPLAPLQAARGAPTSSDRWDRLVGTPSDVSTATLVANLDDRYAGRRAASCGAAATGWGRRQ